MNPLSRQSPRLSNPPLSPRLSVPPKADILGISVDQISRPDALAHCLAFMTSLHKHLVITANSLLLMEAQKNKKLKEACHLSSLIIPESSGVSWAALTLHFSKMHRFPGIDLAFSLLGLCEQHEIPVYLLGGRAGIPKQASRFLYQFYPGIRIVGMRDGYFQKRDHQTIIEDISASRARLVLVALGMPKQEIWIQENWTHLPPALYMGVGGTFDVWAGALSRAPQFFQKSGLEWLYRLKQEPKRWRRMAQLPRFALKVLSHRF